MARRGRFTSPNSGGQNLTALITSLLRERNSAEEQALLNAYRTGTAYNGAVPTADDIQAFYDQWARNAGYAPGTLEYQAIVQKKSDLNNYDLKKQFNALVSTFNTTDGANYQDIINFITGPAQTSTDPNDIADYGNAVESTTSAYLKYQGQRLVRGELSAAEYQLVTLEAISVLDPESVAYENAVYDAYQYEWNAESSKWSNRIKAGTATNAQFRSWANSFQKRIVSSGISTDSDLYTAIGGTIAQANMAVGDSPTNTRLNTTLSDLNSVFTIANQIVGGGKLDYTDIMGSEKDILNKLQENPAAIGLLAAAMDSDPSIALSPALSSLGITDGASLLSWYDGKIKSGLSDAQTITAAGGDANWDDWTGVAKTSGSLTAMDEYTVAATRRARLIDEAKGNPSLITFYNAEYDKYLTGQDSFFGTRPKDQGLFDQQAIVIQNEINALRGMSDGSPTLSGYVGGQEPAWENVNQDALDANDVQNGRAVLAWHPEIGDKGEFVAEDLRSTGPKDGTYQYVSFTVLPNGTRVPQVVSVTGKQIVSEDGKESRGFLYQGPTGNFAVDNDGNFYRVTKPITTRPEGYVVSDFSAVGTKLDGAPLVDLSAFYKPGSLSSINPNAVKNGVTADDLRAAAALVGQVSGAIDPNTQSAIQAQIDTLTADAARQEAMYLYANPTTENFIKAGELLGNPGAATIRANPDLYEEIKPGVFVNKATKDTGNFFVDLVSGLALGPGYSLQYPETIDLRSPEMIAAEKEKEPNFWEILGTNLNPVADNNNLLSGFFGNLILGKNKTTYSNTFAPILPASATTRTVVAPPSPTVRVPDIIPLTSSTPSVPVAPVPQPPQEILPPSRGGGIREL